MADRHTPHPQPVASVRWQLSLAVCAFGSFTTMVAMTLIIPYLPAFLTELGVRGQASLLWHASLAFTATFVVAALAAPLWGWLGDRFGRKLMLVRASLGMAVAMAATGLVTSPEQLIGLRALVGLLGGFASGSTILVADHAPPHRRGFALGVVNSGIMAGSLTGPIIGGLLPGWIGVRTTFLLTGGLIFLTFLLVVIVLPADRPSRSQRTAEPAAPASAQPEPAPEASAASQPQAGSAPEASVASQPQTGHLPQEVRAGQPGQEVQAGQEVRAGPLIVVLLGVFSLIYFAQLAAEPFITVFVETLTRPAGDPALLAGLALSAAAAGTLIAGPVLGALADRRGQLRVLICCLLAAAVLAAAQALITSALVLIALRFALGLALGGLSPCVTAALRTLVPAGRVGRVLGLGVSASYLGQVTGPLTGAAVAAAWGMRPVFLVSGLVLLAAAGLTAALLPAFRAAAAGSRGR